MAGRHRRRTTPVLTRTALGATTVAAGLLGATATAAPADSSGPPVAASLAVGVVSAPVAPVSYVVEERWQAIQPRKQVAVPQSAPELITVKGSYKSPVKDQAPASTVKAASSKAATAVSVALAQRGIMYKWGGTTRAGFDCSGLMQFSYGKAGVKLPRTSSAQSGVGRTVSRANIQPGDLLFYPGHVAMAIGNGQLVESSRRGKPVATRAIYGNPKIKRVV